MLAMSLPHCRNRTIPSLYSIFVYGIAILSSLAIEGTALPLLDFKVDCNEIRSIEDTLNGTIKTVGYPKPYPARSYCQIQLIGNATHKVLVRFRKFYLHHPMGQDYDANTSCGGLLDKLQIYDGLQEEGVLLGEFCGRSRPLPVMSSGSNLTLYLTSYSSGPNATGFLADYAFISNYGITSGEQIGEDVCFFRYNSKKVAREGVITSPNPGGIYPRNTNCTFLFKGDYDEKILLKFEHFDLEGIEPCTARSGSDYLEFSSLPGMDPCAARRCGRFAPMEVVSEGPYFRVNFISNGRLDGLGFAASYTFVTEKQLPAWVLAHRSRSAECFSIDIGCFIAAIFIACFYY